MSNTNLKKFILRHFDINENELTEDFLSRVMELVEDYENTYGELVSSCAMADLIDDVMYEKAV